MEGGAPPKCYEKLRTVAVDLISLMSGALGHQGFTVIAVLCKTVR